MIHTNSTPQDLSVPMPITQEALQIAQQFASEQPTQERALQVYLNTLAVCSVNNYLRIMDIPTSLTASDSWNPIVRLVVNVADLCVTGLGRLECRPMLATTIDVKTVQQLNNNLWLQLINSKSTSPSNSAPLSCYVPSEVQVGRIGYVVVQIDLEQQEATLLGFSPTADTEQLLISQLQPMNELLNHLELQTTSTVTLVALNQWLQGIFEVGWQSLGSLLDAPTVSYAFRRKVANSIRRAKSIELGTPPTEVTVALVVTLMQQNAAHLEISLQVVPLGRENCLPVGLTLAVLDELGATFLKIASGSADRMIQTRQFSGRSGERFHVKLSWDEYSITEYFVI
ncbi:MAG TPA: DUF1822 family protein [Allocoleopsis sp.]